MRIPTKKGWNAGHTMSGTDDGNKGREMKRGLFLFTTVLVVITTSVIMWDRPDPVHASIQDAYESHAKPVEVPYLDMNINEALSTQRGEQNGLYRRDQSGAAEAEQVHGCTEQDSEGYRERTGDDERTGQEEDGSGYDYHASSGELEMEGEPSETDNDGSGEYDDGPEWIYLGDWMITAYCPCAACCGPWATGCTSSGAPAVSNHTVACNILPAGSRILIDDVIFTVEDTGWSPYGDEWIDIFFDTHEEALQYGEKIRSVYLLMESKS